MPGRLAVLGSIIVLSLVMLLTLTIALIRSGRAVPAPWGTRRSRPWVV